MMDISVGRDDEMSSMERRRETRIPHAAKAVMFVASRQLTCHLVNISASAVLLRPPERTAVHQFVRLNLDLPGLEGTIDVDAVVVREEDKPDGYEAALQFVNPTPRAATLLKAFLAWAAEQSAAAALPQQAAPARAPAPHAPSGAPPAVAAARSATGPQRAVTARLGAQPGPTPTGPQRPMTTRPLGSQPGAPGRPLTGSQRAFVAARSTTGSQTALRSPTGQQAALRSPTGSQRAVVAGPSAAHQAIEAALDRTGPNLPRAEQQDIEVALDRTGPDLPPTGSPRAFPRSTGVHGAIRSVTGSQPAITASRSSAGALDDAPVSKQELVSLFKTALSELEGSSSSKKK